MNQDGSNTEKLTAQHSEMLVNGGLTEDDRTFLANFTESQKKTALRKVDWRLVPMLLVLYLISFIDRANIGKAPSGELLGTNHPLIAALTGNARIEGLLPSLGMSGTQYNIALAIFFIPYTLAGQYASSRSSYRR